jgi:hypothetical protein
MKGRIRRKSTHKLQDQDPISSPHKEHKVIGGNVDLDLSLFPLKDSRSCLAYLELN